MKEKLQEVLDLIEQEIKVSKLSIEATDEELKETVGGGIMGYNMKDYSRGSLDAYQIVKKKLLEITE